MAALANEVLENAGPEGGEGAHGGSTCCADLAVSCLIVHVIAEVQAAGCRLQLEVHRMCMLVVV
jgi:hypothetical protein